MQDALMDNDRAEEDYQAGFASVMRFHEYAKLRGWKLSDRQLIHEIIQRERAALISPRKAHSPLLGRICVQRLGTWAKPMRCVLYYVLNTSKKIYNWRKYLRTQ